MRRVATISACVIVLCGCSEEPEELLKSDAYELVSHDGSRALVIRNGRFSFEQVFGDGALTAGGAGGVIKNCSDREYECISMESMVFGVPRGSPPPKSWNIDDSRFRVIATLDRGADTAWIVSVRRRGDTYAHFSYSKRGIETLSLQDEGSPRNMAVTYFLRTPLGPLAH